MADVFEYLKWRGDLTISQDELNEIDNMIFARISYIPLDGIVSEEFGDWITIKEVSEKFVLKDEMLSYSKMESDIKLLEEIGKTNRFQNMYLSGYRSNLNIDLQEQFAALVVKVDKNFIHVSFRGTDDTLVGWKENFNMSFITPVPAQEDSVLYLKEASKVLSGNIITCGHSKGGNLAIYVAAFSSKRIQKRIKKIYNYDGPGFNKDVIDSEEYKRISDRIATFIPQTSIVGMLLEHEEKHTIVKSNQTGIDQHNLYSWEVYGKKFISLEEVDKSSRFVERTLKDWLYYMTPEEREKFIEVVFGIIENTEALTITELRENWYKNTIAILSSLRDMDKDSQKVIDVGLKILTESVQKNISVFTDKSIKNLIPEKKIDKK